MAFAFICFFSAGILNFVHPLEKRLEVVGIFCVISGVVMYGSTIPSLVTAWKNNTTDDVSLPFIVVGLANCTIWLINATLQDDLFMLIQNGCGVLVVLVQLAVYVSIRMCLSASQAQAQAQ
ncbi:bidirectional sugar transporter SWEET7c-like [Carex rostrata]